MSTDRTAKKSTDRGFYFVVALVGIHIGWLVMMPAVPWVAQTTMRRFHLDYESFPAWAIQQTIPAMYNFANRYRVQSARVAGDSESDLSSPAKLVGEIERDDHDSADEFRYINHFPTRVVTFANGRVRHLHNASDCWLTIESSYRGQSIRTVWHARVKEDGRGFRLTRTGREYDP